MTIPMLLLRAQQVASDYLSRSEAGYMPSLEELDIERRGRFLRPQYFVSWKQPDGPVSDTDDAPVSSVYFLSERGVLGPLPLRSERQMLMGMRANLANRMILRTTLPLKGTREEWFAYCEWLVSTRWAS